MINKEKLMAYLKKTILKKSNQLPFIIGLVVLVWMLSGIFFSAKSTDLSGKSSFNQKMTVEVTDIISEEVKDKITIQGEVEPFRKIEIKSHTAAHVLEIPENEGVFVSDGDLIFRLANVDRSAQFFIAKAKISKKLEKIMQLESLAPGDQSKLIKSIEAQKELSILRSNIKKIAMERGNILIKAPFSGILEEKIVEVGSYVEKGESLAVLLDESSLKATGYVSQQNIQRIQLGQKVNVFLLNGKKSDATLTYIAKSGDSKTHSYRVEAQLNNPQEGIKSGASAKIEIITGSVTAHFVSPATLSLDMEGNIGIKSVTKENIVNFHKIEILRTKKDGVWVTGLPDKIKVITQGNGFVEEGESVKQIPSS
jgi:multidrug efflux system membrane fusion protein